MTRRTRRVILISTIIFFIFFAPSVLFYAWGYGFDWEKKKPVLTGGFYFKSIPKNAEIYLDDKLKEKTPAFIKRLIPNYYQIKVSKEGYHPWQKKLRVESELVTEAKNILLIPIEPKTETVEEMPLGQKETTQIFYIHQPSYILYKTDQQNSFNEQISVSPLKPQDYEIFVSPNNRIAVLGENKELYLLDNETKNFKSIAENVKGLQFSSDNNKLLYFTPFEIWVYYLDRTSDNKELMTRLSKEIKKAVWYGKTNEHIIFLVDNQIKITELDSRDERNTIDLLASDNIQNISYNPVDQSIYFVSGKNFIKITLD